MSFGDWTIEQNGILNVQDQTPPDDGASSDPIGAITETTEKATEAATEFLGWIGSGELEALVALGLVIAFTAAQW
ncbi:MAG: hypothetical protein AAGB16_07830, partial [Pseudomonadota bacterium]